MAMSEQLLPATFAEFPKKAILFLCFVLRAHKIVCPLVSSFRVRVVSNTTSITRFDSSVLFDFQ